MSGETRRLAEFAHELRYEDVPAHVRTKAKDLIIDQLGVQLGCSGLPWSLQVRELFASRGGRGDATVVRYGSRLPLPQAVFTNATFGHAFEYDDANPKVHGHPGVELVPTAVAVAEQEHRSGRDLLMAFIAGYEVRSRVGWASDMLEHGGPQYSTACGPFGATVAASRLLGLSVEQTHHAMGIAGSFSGGLMEYDQSGGSVKRILGAIAGQGGVQAALLSKAGITGPTEILEGKRGFTRVYCRTYLPERLTEDLGKEWFMMEALFKPYSCCAAIHPAIDAMREVLDQGLQLSEIESIEAGYPEAMTHHVGITDPKDLLGMQFSTSYSLALTMLLGRNTPFEYTDASLRDPEIAALASKVRVVHDPEVEPFWGLHLPGCVTVRTKSGKVLRAVVPDAKGSKGNPMTSPEVDAKFRSLATNVLGEAQCEQLLRQLRNAESIGDVATTLVPLLLEQSGR